MLENLTQKEIVKGETVDLTITLSEGAFETGDIVSICFAGDRKQTLFSKTATYTPGKNTATFTINGSDTNSLTLPSDGRMVVYYEVKVTNSGNETFFKQETGKLRGQFWIVSRLC